MASSDDLSWQVSFSPDQMMAAYSELEQMASPITKRNQIRPELDEIEEEFMDAFQSYREHEVFEDFKNYKNYYQDAQQ